jgi:hypothetical protein
MIKLLDYFAKNLYIVLGVVLVWRGVWYVLDDLDKLLFAGSHLWTAVAGILSGVLLLYLPDRNLVELKKLKE